MWLSKRKFQELTQKIYDEAIGKGYRLGYEMGQVEICNRMMRQPLSAAILQGKEPSPDIIAEIDDILKGKGL